LKFLDRGSGPAVILLHGTPSPAAHFAGLVEALAPTHRVLVPDLPGYGGEPALAGPDRFQRTTAALASELQGRGIEQATVIGFSGGAYRAVALAGGYPERISQLFLLGGFVTVDAGLRAAWRQIASVVRQGVDLRSTFPSSMLSEAFAAAHPEAVAEVATWLDGISAVDLADEFDSFVEVPDYGTAFSQLRIPITLRNGSLDRAAPPLLAKAAGQLNPGAVVQIVPNCGHALLIEDRSATLEAIVGALAVETSDRRPVGNGRHLS